MVNMSNNNNEDRARILREARATLDRRPEPYQYRALPRMLYDDPPEPEFEPAPARSPRLDTAPEQRSAPTADPWAGWERWLSVRIESALVEERERTAEIMAEALGLTIAREREAAQRELNAQVGELKVETAKLEHAMKHLASLIELEKNRSLDLPALPARDRFN
jgi:hypothetical protein